MKRIVYALMAILLVSAAKAVPVPPPAGTVVQAPNWVVGSEWYYSDGYALKVTSSTPRVTVFDRIDAPGQWFSREGFVRKDSTSATATRNAIYRTVSEKAGYSLSAATPLTFQREYLSNGSLMVHASSWAVEGRETITVPAGTFDCWLIVWRTRSLKSDWTGFERWWYSPQAQQYVRMEYKYGPGAEGSRVLMRYRIGPAPTPVAESTVPTPLAASESRLIIAETKKTVEAPPPVKAAAPEPASIPDPPIETPAATVQKSAIGLPAAAANSPQPSPAAVPAVPDKPRLPNIAAVMPPSTGGSWHAQVGSSKDAAAMRASLQKIIVANPQLAKLPSGVTPHAIEGRGTFYRAWVGAFDRQGDAQTVCATLKSCAVFKAQTREARNN